MANRTEGNIDHIEKRMQKKAEKIEIAMKKLKEMKSKSKKTNKKQDENLYPKNLNMEGGNVDEKVYI